MWLLAAFILIPLIEIGLFIQVGGAIGLWPTLLIVVLTAIVGTSLVRSQGAAAMSDLRRSMNELRDPSEPLANGAMILAAGLLLLTPGFFTDAVGLSLLIPGVRRYIFREARKRIRVQTFTYGTATHGAGTIDPRGPRPRPGARGDVIEGEAEEVETGPRDPRAPRSGWETRND
ncbi:FxsA family protein [Palleronia sediminis]|uniref:FxsA family protein n=1 Tax=Palleronia sediminis TaxID=2547833 RepID=A0A4V3B985_9RHOB|nr:FxsA family protein [Palleronia sediminis]TDL78329.1 FxsA family protein [Palleronia sediminis]